MSSKDAIPPNAAGGNTPEHRGSFAVDPPPDEEKGSSPPPAEDVRSLTGLNWFLFVISTLTSIFLYALDNTIVANIVPAIIIRFDSINQLPWLSVGFMIGGVAMVMPFGKLYSLYDGKWLYIISTVVFMAASALCGAAPNMTAEIVGRVFAGAGGNGMYFGLLTLLSTHTTNKERPAYLSLTGMCWGLGTVLGPVIGGSFELVTWRWAFYINLVFGAVLLPTYYFVIPSTMPVTGVSIWKRAVTFDWTGAVLSVAAFTVSIMAISFGGAIYAWNSGSTIALFVVAGVLWFLFAIQQTFNILTTSENRMFPVHLLRNKEVVLLFISCASVGAVAYVTVYYIPIYFQFTRGHTALGTAVDMLPFIVLLITTIPTSGFFMSKVGYYKPWYLGGSILALIGGVLMSTVKSHTSVSAIYGFEVLLGIGSGAFTQASFAVVQAVIKPKDAGSGITVMLIAQLCGLAYGLSVAGAIFLNKCIIGLTALLPGTPTKEIQQIVAGTSGTFISQLPPAVREQALTVIVSAWEKVFIGVYVAAATCLVCAAFLDHKRAYVPAAAGAG